VIAIADAILRNAAKYRQENKSHILRPYVQNCSVVETFAQLETIELAEFKYYQYFVKR